MEETEEVNLNNKEKVRIFDPEYYSLPFVEDSQIHVVDDIVLKKFGVVENIIDFIGIN